MGMSQAYCPPRCIAEYFHTTLSVSKQMVGKEIRTRVEQRVRRRRGRRKAEERGILSLLPNGGTRETDTETTYNRGNEKITTRSGQICGLSIPFDPSPLPESAPRSLWPRFSAHLPPSPSLNHPLAHFGPVLIPLSPVFYEPLRIGKRSCYSRVPTRRTAPFEM